MSRFHVGDVVFPNNLFISQIEQKSLSPDLAQLLESLGRLSSKSCQVLEQGTVFSPPSPIKYFIKLLPEGETEALIIYFLDMETLDTAFFKIGETKISSREMSRDIGTKVNQEYLNATLKYEPASSDRDQILEQLGLVGNKSIQLLSSGIVITPSSNFGNSPSIYKHFIKISVPTANGMQEIVLYHISKEILDNCFIK